MLCPAQTINQWLAEQDKLPSGTRCERAVGGFSKFQVCGTTISAIAQPYRFYLLKRAQDAFDAMSGAEQQAMKAILDRCNMAPILQARLTRDITFEDNREVWA